MKISSRTLYSSQGNPLKPRNGADASEHVTGVRLDTTACHDEQPLACNKMEFASINFGQPQNLSSHDGYPS